MTLEDKLKKRRELRDKISKLKEELKEVETDIKDVLEDEWIRDIITVPAPYPVPIPYPVPNPLPYQPNHWFAVSNITC